ncbi:unnamed protein product [Vitrella brassicaformis CCMP3155]|uniref:Uncharacterized protein n=1 Tax=Vitrella brassicaformis (strain CCMP3155) TaxID=1169540 RepID=A0A0G4FA01_VITBC|nr:unnamed protein product [Vitrella brassicaformis CCMP3155]|eukprot:CEM09116.1 unnamed protein product [Vitrella brassicaformis CCMP3155]
MGCCCARLGHGPADEEARRRRLAEESATGEVAAAQTSAMGEEATTDNTNTNTQGAAPEREATMEMGAHRDEEGEGGDGQGTAVQQEAGHQREMDRSMSTLVPAIELTLERERDRDREREAMPVRPRGTPTREGQELLALSGTEGEDMLAAAAETASSFVSKAIDNSLQFLDDTDEAIEGKKKCRTAVQLAVDGYRQQIDDMRATKGGYRKKREAIREREQRMRERQVEIDALDKDIQLLQARITARPQSPSQSPRQSPSQSAGQSPTQPPAQPTPDTTPRPPTRAPQGRRQSKSAAAAAAEEAMDEAARADRQQATDDALLFFMLDGHLVPQEDEERLRPRYEAITRGRRETAPGAGADVAPDVAPPPSQDTPTTPDAAASVAAAVAAPSQPADEPSSGDEGGDDLGDEEDLRRPVRARRGAAGERKGGVRLYQPVGSSIWRPRPVTDFPSPSGRRGATMTRSRAPCGCCPPPTAGGGVPMRRDVVQVQQVYLDRILADVERAADAPSPSSSSSAPPDPHITFVLDNDHGRFITGLQHAIGQARTADGDWTGAGEDVGCMWGDVVVKVDGRLVGGREWYQGKLIDSVHCRDLCVFWLSRVDR